MSKASKKKNKASKTTRQAAAVFGLGTGITGDDAEITGSRLPTNEQVLRCYMFYQRKGSAKGSSSSSTKRDNAKIVLTKIIPFYQKGNVKMISEKSACEKIMKLVEKNHKIRGIPTDRRSHSGTKAKLKVEVENELKKTFPLWAKDAEDCMKNQDDIKFLQSMKTDRVASFGCYDQAHAAQVNRRQVRELRQVKFKEKTDKKREIEMSIAQLASSSEEEIVSDTSEEDELGRISEEVCSEEEELGSRSKEVCSEKEAAVSSSSEDVSIIPAPTKHKKSHHRTARPGTSAFVPHDILKSPKLVSLATRIKLSPTEQAAYTKAIIQECGGDPSKIAASYSTADRSRRQVGGEIAKSIREQWYPPEYISLHWDSKLLHTLEDKNVNEERLTVAVGDVNEIKLLGVPSYQPGTGRHCGEIITEKSMELLNLWNCADAVVNMVFDTTASNTGHVSAACVTLQKATGRALLWSACRHHVGEVILTQVFTDLKIEASKSPEIALFSRFRKQFDQIPHDVDESLSFFDSALYPRETQDLLHEWRTEAVSVSTSSSQHQRDDYREFSELCLLYLDGSQRHQNLRRPGAMHKARWMSKLLYSIKIVLLKHQVNSFQANSGKSIITKQQNEKLREFVTFVCLVYSTWWNACSKAADAPWIDLCLYNNLLRYKLIHSIIATSAITALKRHLWYLTAEMVPLALFSSLVPSDELRLLANKLLAVKPENNSALPRDRFGTGFGKPKFHKNITDSTTLADLVTSDSWLVFSLLDLDSEFLTEDVDQWQVSASFLSSKTKIGAINVVNDCAERGVKLSADFLNTARSEEHYQNVLQVVEADRKKTPNLRKRKANVTK